VIPQSLFDDELLKLRKIEKDELEGSDLEVRKLDGEAEDIQDPILLTDAFRRIAEGKGEKFATLSAGPSLDPWSHRPLPGLAASSTVRMQSSSFIAMNGLARWQMPLP
jgi:hypothetical protein